MESDICFQNFQVSSSWQFYKIEIENKLWKTCFQ